jgi:hypothetical protein
LLPVARVECRLIAQTEATETAARAGSTSPAPCLGWTPALCSPQIKKQRQTALLDQAQVVLDNLTIRAPIAVALQPQAE